MPPLWNVWKSLEPPLTSGICSVIGQLCVHPLDTITVQTQLSASEGGSASPLCVALALVEGHGVWVLYTGIGAGILRQVIYAVTRQHLFDRVLEAAQSKEEKRKRRPTALWKSVTVAVTSGGIAGLAANLADLALVRMQADVRLPIADRRGLDNLGTALATIASEEGLLGLFVGSCITAVRAAALNFGFAVFNVSAKTWLSQLGLGKPRSDAVVCGAVALSGLPATAISLPLDYAQTQAHTIALQAATPDFSQVYAGLPVQYKELDSSTLGKPGQQGHLVRRGQATVRAPVHLVTSPCLSLRYPLLRRTHPHCTSSDSMQNAGDPSKAAESLRKRPRYESFTKMLNPSLAFSNSMYESLRKRQSEVSNGAGRRYRVVSKYGFINIHEGPVVTNTIVGRLGDGDTVESIKEDGIWVFHDGGGWSVRGHLGREFLVRID